MTVKRLIGTDPSQVPRNKDLGSLAFQNKDAPRFDTLTIDGAVGIGTTTPAYALDVFPVSGSSNSIIRAYGPSIARLSLQNSTRHYSMSVQGSNLLIYDETGGATRMTLLSSGELSIANGITPQYYNEQTLSYPTIRPTLNLDFAGSKSVDSRITFTRASSATYYGDDGKIKYAVQNEPRIEYDPVTGECKGLLIEEQRTNLNTSNLNYNAYYTIATQNAAIAPDGTLTAIKFAASSASSSGHRYEIAHAVTAATTYTHSVYVKAAGINYVHFFTFTDNSGYSSTGAGFNLSSGTTTTVQAGCVATITPVGNGWYRISATVTSNLATSAAYIAWGLGDIGAGQAFSGNNIDGAYIWGYQREVGAFPTSYIPSTTTFTSRASSATYFDSTGTLRIAGTNQARYGYGYDSTSGKWVSQGLLLEAATTNLCSSSLPKDWVSASGDTSFTAPDGSVGTVYNRTATSLASINISSNVSSSTVYTYSIYVKNNGQSTVRLNTYSGVSGSDYGTYFDLVGSGSAWGSYGTGFISAKIEQVGNGWYRVSETFLSAVGTTFISLQVHKDNAAGSLLFWGAQLETGYIATSHIPTNGIQVTRAADVSSSAATTRIRDDAIIYNVDKLGFNYDEGALYAEGSWSSANSSGLLSIVPGNTDNWNTGMMMLGEFNSGVTCGLRIFTSIGGANATAQIDSSFAVQSVNTYHKMSGAWKTNDAASVIDSLSVVTDSSVIPMPNLTTFKIGSSYNSALKINGTIKKIVYYPKRISNAQLQALTA